LQKEVEKKLLQSDELIHNHSTTNIITTSSPKEDKLVAKVMT